MSCSDPWWCAYPCDGSHVHSPYTAPSDTMGLDSQNGPGEARERLNPEPQPHPRCERRKDLE
jgi:hypothetical protein